MKATGIFDGNANSPTRIPISSNYQTISLQITYPNLGSNKDFDLDPTQGSIIVNDQNGNYLTTLYVNQNQVKLTSALNLTIGNLELYFNIYDVSDPQLQSLVAITNSNPSIKFIADLFLIFNKQNNTLSYGTHLLNNMRAQFMGITNISNTNPPPNFVVDNSCDSWGTNFTLLVPSADFNMVNRSSCCGTFDADFYLETPGAHGIGQDDFSNEFRPYGALDNLITITVPSDYTVVSADFVMDQRNYANSPNTNNYASAFSTITIPNITFTSLNVTGGTQYTFNGLNNSCWPLLDVKPEPSAHPTYHIVLHTTVNCSAQAVAAFTVNGGYTEGTNQSTNLAYQIHHTISQTYQVTHNIPNLVLTPPQNTVDAYSNSAVFNFEICNQNPSTCDANDAWVAFENSSSNSLNFISVINTTNPLNPITLPNTAIQPYTTTTNTSGLLVDLGSLPIGDCIQLQLNAQINSNGCVNINAQSGVQDQLNVIYGNNCTNATLPSPPPVSMLPSCPMKTVPFNFTRYPSDLQLVFDNNQPNHPPYPDAANLCGTLEYNLILESSQLGTITNPAFLINNLPAGITLQNITFTYPYGSTNTYIYNAPISFPIVLSTTFPVISNGLPGLFQLPNNLVGIQLEFITDCNYLPNAGTITFSATGISSCGLPLTPTLPAPTPPIPGLFPPDDLSYNIAVSNGVNCTNTSLITITVINNGGTATNQNNVLTVNFPNTNLQATNPSPFTTINDPIIWGMPQIPANGQATFSFDLGIINPSIITCPGNQTITAAISYNESITCVPNTQCNFSYPYSPVSNIVNICCTCNQSNPLTVNISSSTNVSPCPGGSNGSATASASGGNPPYTYSWNTNPPQTTPTANNLSAGTYVVTVTDALGGCSVTANVTITQPTPIGVNFTHTDVSCNGGNDGSATANPSGGVTPYTYAWSTLPVQNTQMANNLSVGVYQCTVTDANGCTGIQSVTISQPTVLSVSTTQIDISCNGGNDGSATANPSGGVPPYAYAWSTTPPQNTQTINNLSQGPYQCIITDANGCTASVNVTIIINPNSECPDFFVDDCSVWLDCDVFARYPGMTSFGISVQGYVAPPANPQCSGTPDPNLYSSPVSPNPTAVYSTANPPCILIAGYDAYLNIPLTHSVVHLSQYYPNTFPSWLGPYINGSLPPIDCSFQLWDCSTGSSTGWFQVGNSDCITLPTPACEEATRHVAPDSSIKKVFNFNLFPNPAKNNITLYYSLPVNQSGIFELYDVYGKLCVTNVLMANTKSMEINIVSLSDGIYYCRLSIGKNNTEVKKLVIAK